MRNLTHIGIRVSVRVRRDRIEDSSKGERKEERGERRGERGRRRYVNIRFKSLSNITK